MTTLDPSLARICSSWQGATQIQCQEGLDQGPWLGSDIRCRLVHIQVSNSHLVATGRSLEWYFVTVGKASVAQIEKTGS
jgi:hypothetical protein